MKGNYMSTNWEDNKTPVNAANMNNIERGIKNLYQNAIGRSDLVPGNGIKIGTTKEGSLEVATTDQVVKSTSCKEIEFVKGELGLYENGILYFILDPDTGKLKKIMLGKVVIYEVNE